jgi:hypothetical protein
MGGAARGASRWVNLVELLNAAPRARASIGPQKGSRAGGSSFERSNER